MKFNRHSFIRLGPILLCLLTLINVTGHSQHLNEWQAHTSLSSISNITMDAQQHIWATTEGGILIFKDGKKINSLTTLDGLSELSGSAITFDSKRDQIIVGYPDGSLDIINIENFNIETRKDIYRADRYNPRGINSLIIHEDFLFVATAFGIVKYNLSSLLVEESYTKLGDFNRAIKVNDLFISPDDTLYAATSQGIAYASIHDNLSLFESWKNHDENSGFSDIPVHAIIEYSNNLYASTVNANFKYNGTDWKETKKFGNSTVLNWSLNRKSELLSAFTHSSVFTLDKSNTKRKHTVSRFKSISTGFITQGNNPSIWIGTAARGLGNAKLDDEAFDFYRPKGPYLNFFNALQSEDSVLVASSILSFPGADPLTNIKGYYILDNKTWKNYNKRTSAVLDQYSFANVFSTAIGKKNFYFGSWGSGIAQHNRKTDSIQVYNNQNSNIEGLDSDHNFIVTSGIATDNDNNVWTVSFFSRFPLYFKQQGSEKWNRFRPEPTVSSADKYFDIFVDSFNQKWITLIGGDEGGRGLLVMNTGDPKDPDDDRSVKLTTDRDNGNLPNPRVQSIIQDKNDEVWIGTAKGVARFILPTRIIGGDSNDRRAQWLINEDTTAESPFLLRDVNVTSMAVNAANQKWIGSQNNGVWLVNAEGSRIIHHFTAENSPLFSNQVLSVSVQNETGTVFFATSKGLISYTDVPRKGAKQLESLNIYPNPYSYTKHGSVIIDDLSDETTIRIVSIDGTLVDQLEARGGRVQWDARDFNGNKISTGVYLIVALGQNSNQKTVGKLVIVK